MKCCEYASRFHNVYCPFVWWCFIKFAEYNYAECCYTKCRYAKCHYAECCGAKNLFNPTPARVDVTKNALVVTVSAEK